MTSNIVLCRNHPKWPYLTSNQINQRINLIWKALILGLIFASLLVLRKYTDLEIFDVKYWILCKMKKSCDIWRPIYREENQINEKINLVRKAILLRLIFASLLVFRICMDLKIFYVKYWILSQITQELQYYTSDILRTKSYRPKN